MKIEKLFRKAANGDSATLRELSSIADQGDAEAAFQLGRLYDESIAELGRVLPANNATARIYFERAAIHGHALAQLCLGNMYDYGEGGEQDYELARRWYLAAAAQGVVDAQMHYARMVQMGRGGYLNREEAAEWYVKAIEQGDELAATNLGALHYGGELANSSDDIAFKLFSFSADKLDGAAHLYLGDMNMAGRGTPEHGGRALFHFCVAALLLPDGVNKRTASARMESAFKQHPCRREEFQSRAMTYISRKRGKLPT